MDFIPFDAEAETGRWRRHLPHWEQSGCTYFVTFRTADSIPAEKLNQWKSERDEFERNHPKPWSDVEWRVYRAEFLDRIERWSDRGYGECLLRRPQLRRIVSDALECFNERPESRSSRYQLGDWVIMPNHVHLLVRPLPPWALGQLIHSWKSFTAKAINKAIGGSGAFWLDERFDHLVRHSASLEKYAAYITNNPVKAGLCEGEYTLSKSHVGLASRQSSSGDSMPDEDRQDAGPTCVSAPHVGLASRQSRAGEPGPEFTDFKPDQDRHDAGPT
jgi:REP element-mobilizing transposase RayT